MYRWILLMWFLFSTVNATAQQNMVPNGDFEYYTTCPAGNPSNLATGWSIYSPSPSYYHTCGGTGSIPGSGGHYQWPASGNGHLNFTQHLYWSTSGASRATRSIIPLTPGKVYEVSLSLNLVNLSTWASNEVGVYFFDNGPAIYHTSPFPYNVQIHYGSCGAFTDTQNWVRLTRYFVADSAYDNIVIGGFTYPQGADTIQMLPSTPSTILFSYWIDSRQDTGLHRP